MSRSLPIASVSTACCSGVRSTVETARSRTRAPSSSIISVSTSAAILMAASWCQVPYGSDQPSTRYDQRPVVGALTVTVQKSRPGLVQVIGRSLVAPDGSVSTTFALTASCPSR